MFDFVVGTVGCQFPGVDSEFRIGLDPSPELSFAAGNISPSLSNHPVVTPTRDARDKRSRPASGSVPRGAAHENSSADKNPDPSGSGGRMDLTRVWVRCVRPHNTIT